MATETDMDAQPTHDDLRRLCGDVVDWKLIAIVETGASLEEVEEAAAWVAGADDVMGDARKRLSGKVAEVFDILVADEELAEENRLS
jgi:hypothetical protein